VVAVPAGLRIVAIIQARTTSSRFPRKVLADLAGQPLLAWVLRRARASAVDEVVVATTVNAADDPVIAIAEREDVRWFRGEEHDVLGRYVQAAREAGADAVVRLTADCPMLDAEVIDMVIDALRKTPAVDYSANVIERTFPQGLDAEALFFEALVRSDRLGTSPDAREHVTWFIREERPDLFRLRSVVADTRPLPYRDVVAYARSAAD
jgi:spore coat polysaccharide biosynthesis protein SpsF